MSHEFKKLLMRRETYILLCISLVISAAAFFETVMNSAGINHTLLPSAVEAGMLWNSSIGTVYIYIMPLLAAACYADSYFIEQRSQYITIDITRCHSGYILNKYIVVLLGGFLISVLAPLINLLLCYIAFPNRAFRAVETGSIYTTSIQKELQWVLFPKLYVGSPLLYALIHIGLMGIMGSLLSGLSFCITLFYRKNTIIAIGSGEMVYLFLTIGASSLGMFDLTPFHYFLLRPSGFAKNISIFLAISSAILTISIVMLFYKNKATKDILAE